MAMRPINWSNPLTRGLVYDAYFPGTGTAIPDRTGNSPDLTLAGGAGWGTGALGACLTLAGGAGDLAAADNGVGLPVGATDDFTLEVAAELTATTDLAFLFGFGGVPALTGSATKNMRGWLTYGGGASDDLYFWGAGADLDSGVRFDKSGALKVYGLVRKYVAGVSDTLTFFRDGLAVASGDTPSLLTAGTTITIGSRHPAAAGTVTGKVGVARVYDVARTGSEMAAVATDPFAFLANPGGTYYYQLLG